MSAPTAMARAALAEWRRLGSQRQDAIRSSLLLPHCDRPHGFDRELLHSWPGHVYASLHRRGLTDAPAWPSILTPAGLMVLDAGIEAES